MSGRFNRQDVNHPSPHPQHPSAERRPARLGAETSLGQVKGVEPVCTCKTVCFGSCMEKKFRFMLPAVPLKLFMERLTPRLQGPSCSQGHQCLSQAGEGCAMEVDQASSHSISCSLLSSACLSFFLCEMGIIQALSCWSEEPFPLGTEN